MIKLIVFLAFLAFSSLSMFADNSSKKQTVLIMLGAPGAGKGTQAVRLSKQHELPHISTGDLFRENMKNNTPIGEKAKSYMKAGKLVPDEIVLEMLFDRIESEDCKNGYILDGVPRTIAQAEILDKHFGNANVIAISLEVPDEIIVDRLTSRIVCEKCGAIYNRKASPPAIEGVCDRCQGNLIQRKDDTEEIILKRLSVYHKETAPLKEYYQKKGNLILIDSSISKDETTAKIDASLKGRIH